MKLQQFYLCVFLIVAITVSVDTQSGSVPSTDVLKNSKDVISCLQLAVEKQLKQCDENCKLLVARLNSPAFLDTLNQFSESIRATEPGLSRAAVAVEVALEVASAVLHVLSSAQIGSVDASLASQTALGIDNHGNAQLLESF